MVLSRKSYLGRITGLDVNNRDPIGNAISLFLISNGVRIFRTHDTEGLNSVIKFYKALEEV